ncbi:MAG: hypothetical protein WCF84_17125 [Anaerolineae bacterium]
MIQALLKPFKSIWGFIFYLGPIDPAQAATWRQVDLARLRDAPGVDARALGELLGAGLQHRIYEYQEDARPMVLKVLIPTRWLRLPNIAEAQEDIALVSRFFGSFAISPTEVIPLHDGTYAIKQRRLGKFSGLTPPDLEQESVRRKFFEVVRRNHEMIVQAGRSLDFLGREGQRKCRAAFVGFRQTPTISNIVVETCPDGAENLWVMDTDLEKFYPHATNLRDLRSGLAARMAVEINRFLILRLFGIDLLAPP